MEEDNNLVLVRNAQALLDVAVAKALEKEKHAREAFHKAATNWQTLRALAFYFSLIVGLCAINGVSLLFLGASLNSTSTIVAAVVCLAACPLLVGIIWKLQRIAAEVDITRRHASNDLLLATNALTAAIARRSAWGLVWEILQESPVYAKQ